MSVASIISDFEALGVYLWAENDQLKFKAPAGVLNNSHKQRLSQHKTELLAFLADPLMEKIVPDEENRYQPFPLTDLQLAYLVGRNNVIEYGGVGCHSYIELDLPSTDLARLEQAWHQLILRHDMLRAKISQEGQQSIMPKVELPSIMYHDYKDNNAQETEQQMFSLRESLAHRCYKADQWPQYELHLSQHQQGSVLHFSIDLLIADFASIQILLAELGELYNHPDRQLSPLQISYRDVVLAKKRIQANTNEETRYQKHKNYWFERIKTLPQPPELPMAATVPTHGNEEKVTFDRLHVELPKEQWQALCKKASSRQITPSSLVLSAFTETLSRWAKRPEFCLNLTMLNRSTAHPDIRGIVGDFIEVNVLGVQPDPTQDFSSRTLALQQQLWRDLEHSDFSGIDVLREMSRQQQSNVIVPIVYTSTVGLSGDDLDANEFMHNAKLRYGITQTPQVWLDCQATERNGSLIVHWDVRDGVFRDDIIAQAHDTFCRLLHALTDNDSSWQSNSPVTLPQAMLSTRERVNKTETPLPDSHLHTGFCRYALEQPNTIATIYAGQQTSYRTLANKAFAIREVMQGQVAPNDRVAIVMDKSSLQIAAVLAVLLANATYVPIEASQPVARRNAILQDANVNVVLTIASNNESAWPSNINLVTVDTIQPITDKATQQHLEQALIDQQEQSKNTAEKTGYIIYTSGTTGIPKGVMISHRSALNTLTDINQRFNVTPQDNVLGLVSFAFDLSIWDIFGTLSAGATLVLPNHDKRADPNHWAQVMEDYKVSVWNSVPAQMQMLMTCLEWNTDIKLAQLRVAMMSGDWIPVALPDVIRARCPQVQVVSLGGPTETSIWCVCHAVQDVPDNATSIPYGTAMQNHQIHILNERLEICPDWVTGEMYIAGAGLAQGYAGDQQKTTERFFEHPETGQRLYRSGDLGRYRSDGIIEILGRDDGQVKINGHRIEVGEVESIIANHPAISTAAVVAIGTPPQLAAMAIAKVESDNKEELLNSITTYLTEQLPQYMHPSTLVIESTLPLNNNSKVDRKALHLYFANSHRQIDYFEAPLDTPIEQQVAKIWRELLDVEQISRNDDFFHIGGSSLTAINLLSAYLAQGFDADIDLIFNNTIFCDMVSALEQSNSAKAEWIASIDLSKMANKALTHFDNASAFEVDKPIQNILVTGSSGFLGTYLLNRLLQKTDYHIYCLLRCDNKQHGFSRLQQAAKEKGLSDTIIQDRITVIPGELSKSQLGLSNEDYQHLSGNVDLIIHNASIINLMDPLSALYPTNVEGVTSIIELASTSKIKPIQYVSTIGVHHALPENVAQPVVEKTPVVTWQDVELTYEQSKIMGETLFGHARKKGLPVNILRPGTITWDTSSTPFINDDAFLKFYRACLNIKAYPASSLAVNIVPVDHVADSIVAITKDQKGQSKNYHLVSQTSTQVGDVYNWCNELGCTIEPLPFEQWKDKLDDNFVQSFVNLYFKQGMEGGGHHQYSSDNMREVIEKFDISPFEVTQEYLKPLTERFNNAEVK